MASNFAYAVIGAGIEGSATAYYLAKNGFKTVLLEQFRQGHTRGSSHGNSRITRKVYNESPYVHMMQRAYELWDELEKESGEQLFKKTGILYFGAVDGDEIKNCIESMSAHNLPYTLLNHREVNEKFPQLKFDAKWRALYEPDAGLLKADRCLRSFQDQFVKYGGVIRDGDAVTNIETTGGNTKISTASGAEYTCNGVAICAGTWSKSFLDEFLGLKLPLQPMVVKSCYWKVEKKGLYSAANFPCIISHFDPAGVKNEDAMCYGTPSDEYTDLLKFCSHGGVNINHPDERDSVDASEYIEKPRKYISEHFEHVQTKPAVVETCLYTVTPDENFVLDKHPKFENIAIGAGFSGHGFKFAAVVGEILGSFLLKKPLPFDLSMFKIDRFQ